MAQSGESIMGYDFNDLTGRIIGAAIETHRELGPGFQEVVYQRALALELDAAGLEYTREAKVPVAVLPFTVGGSERAKDLVSLFDDTIETLLKALK